LMRKPRLGVTNWIPHRVGAYSSYFSEVIFEKA
jgi:hypothetical protein